jgi:hypothetical protein
VTVADDFICGVCGPGTGTPGYWKNHPRAWPVDMIEIGGVTYPNAVAIDEMNQAVKRNKCITLFKALVAAKLDVILNSWPPCADGAISEANDWMEENCSDGEEEASSEAWQDSGQCLYRFLDAYNNGYLCVPSRDVSEEELDS